MIRSAASKVMWVGRATVFMVGLAVILALVFGAATTAMGADGKPFLLGKRNVATLASKLINRGEGPALSLKVGEGQPPLAVDSSAKVANLNADQLDGKSEADFQGANAAAGGELTGNYPNPAIAGGAITPDKLADRTVLWAMVEADGTVASTNYAHPTLPGVSSEKLATGRYDVTFPGIGNLDPCASIAQLSSSSNSPPPGGEAATAQGARSANRIQVITRNSAGELEDKGFTVVAFCPE
ncbi:MAG: hypothetical protein AVDCRST_MAG03-3272 [uncultured Rubrobacteraceae bacterium]|uniref:Uncharacterized protein n=1 Tax=uncultured Rubrobacteraceae bacterium TaxID=349277 RepID=A0A6J4Q423_9ACTN|nr:MAG: hypothetical protein AVDCRST_MAG03-3272 [uncultured Rubrobacteraceae bacterium]